MAKFVFSDPHFYSESIIVNGRRPFKDVAEMNRNLILNYNSVVGKQEMCYWLGDIMYGATKERVANVLRQLRGRKYLIMGNHD
ncbi:MAG: hydrolase, partial [Alphaproteobacteria bacterium]|nr:hydrolase [Alphaproteobacteria bacterium]